MPASYRGIGPTKESVSRVFMKERVTIKGRAGKRIDPKLLR